MAERRMFAKSVISSARFLRMPASSRLLYYDLGMQADDDGVVEAFTVMRTTSATEDDLRVLISKRFITLLNDDWVAYINDWGKNNFIRPDRYKQSVYAELLVKVLDVENADDNQMTTNGIPDDNQMTTNGIPNGNQRETQVRLGKDSIGKDNINTICPEPEKPAPDRKPEDESGIRLSLNDGTEYNVPLSKIKKWTAAYPVVDVKQELLKMSAWLDSNRTKRKTRRGIDRFINSWLSGEQDKGGTRRAAVQAGQVQKPQTRFNNFDQRSYDYLELERQLLKSQERK